MSIVRSCLGTIRTCVIPLSPRPSCPLGPRRRDGYRKQNSELGVEATIISDRPSQVDHTESSPKEDRLVRAPPPETPPEPGYKRVGWSESTRGSADDRSSASQCVLVVASALDPEADLLAATIEARGGDFVRINIEDLPSSIRVTYRPGAGVAEGTLNSCDVSTSLADFSAAWAPGLGRGSLAHVFDEPRAGLGACDDWSWALCDLARWMPCLWVNHPTAVQSASDGLLQIRIARQVGLEVPRTIMTNDPARVRELRSQSSGGIIARAVGHYRCATNVHPMYACGQILDSHAFRRMDDVEFAPAIFQERADEWSRLRVYVVGDRVFPIDVPMSFRSASTRLAQVGLPAEVEGQYRLLPRRLGLVFAAIDLARTRDGRYLFLDLNPVPTWLWLEERTSVPITAALVDLLTTPHEQTFPDLTPGGELV